MAHFAKVHNGIVVQVIVAEPEFFTSFVDTSPGEWIQTSYNTHGGVHYNPETRQPSEDQSKSLRKNFAGVGFSYDSTLDAFIPPKQYASWTLNEESCMWQAPVAMPSDGNGYMWDEQNQIWEQVSE